MAKEKVSVSKKVGCSIAIGIATALIVFAFCGRFFNSGIKNIANFFVGSFGMAFYGLMIAVIVIASFLLAGRKVEMPKKYIAHFALLFVTTVLLVHMYSSLFIYNASETFAQYASYVYNYYTWVPTFGGIVFGMVAYALQRVLTIYGASVVLFGLLIWSVITIGDFFYCYFTGKIVLVRTSKLSASAPEEVAEESVAEEIPEDEKAKALKILFSPEEQPPQQPQSTEVFDRAPQTRIVDQNPNRKLAEDILFNNAEIPTSQIVQEDDSNVTEAASQGGYFETPTRQQEQPAKEPLPWFIKSEPTQTPSEPAPQQKPAQTQPAPAPAPEQQPQSKPKGKTKTIITEDEVGGQWIKTVPVEEEDEPAPVAQTPAEEEQPQTLQEVDVTEVFVADTPEEPQQEPQVLVQPQAKPQTSQVEQPTAEVVEEVVEEQEPEQVQPQEDHSEELVAVEHGKAVGGGIQMGYDFMPKQQLEKAQQKIHHYPEYVKPPFDLLEEAVEVEDTEQEYRERAAQEIVKKLSVFGIQIESVGQVVGPSVTRYEFKVLSEKTRMGDFRQYSADIKACLEATDDIIIQAPITGTNLVGVEVANKKPRPVKLRTLLESPEFQNSKANLAFVIGQEITGQIVVGDLSKLPHLLVAGTTGSGKSVFLHSLIISLMYRYGPEYMRFIMVDPKLVELSRYNGIPHMLTSETIISTTDALASMDYLVNEMEARYQLFRQNGVVNISTYNEKINPKVQQRLPYLVLVVDELADLMSVSQKQFEAKLLRLAQKSRAAGIHMVLATQRPDVKTITGTIKTNFSCRVALKVAAPQDSMTILSAGGAEKLLGKGDMLYLGEGQASPTRIQGAYVSDDEIPGLVQYVKSVNEVYFDENISKQIFASEQPEEEETQASETDSDEEKLDPYCKKALRFWLERQNGRASIASIQRSLKIGFNRAGRIMDSLQRLHYVEEIPSNETSSRPVKVLVTLEELDNLFPDMED